MNGSGPIPNPERLMNGKHGRLLKQANREFAANLDQPAAFHRVNQRLAAARYFSFSRPSLWLVPAALALAGLVAMRVASVTEAPLLVAAEQVRGFSPKASPPASVGETREPIPDSKVSPDARSSSPRSKRLSEVASASPSASAMIAAAPHQSHDAPASAAPLPAPPGASSSAPEASVAADPPPTAAGPDCLSLARSGKTRDAEACFLKRAEGSGLGAEMALYEVARLRRDVLADAEGALRALAEYRARFPGGSLRREADMSQLELLVQLGRSEDALRRSAELLASSSSGERAAELHLLRGHILRKSQSSFAAAALEYELAEKAGARAPEVKYFRALCLDALGRSGEASALFSEYLAQPRPLYADDAKRRLERLQP